MIKFIDPRGSVATEMEPYSLSVDIRAGKGLGVTVALLANGFPDSELFVRKIGKALRKCLPDIETRVWNKGNAGVAASDELIAEIVSDCQAAITAYGH